MSQATVVKLVSKEDFHLASWLIKPNELEIIGQGECFKVQPKVMQVLLALSAQSGRAVSREALMETIWQNQVVTDDSLSRCISQMRKIFHRPESGVSIDTVARVGYRLTFDGDLSPAMPNSESTTSTQPLNFKLVGIGLVVALLLLVVAATAVWLPMTDSDEANTRITTARPLTALPGREIYPALSPSGGQFAYSRKDPDSGNWVLYTQALDSQTQLALTDNSAYHYLPAWSPDGSQIAFVKQHRPTSACGIYTIAALGGPLSYLADCGPGQVIAIDWSPNGQHLLFVSEGEDAGKTSATLIDANTGEARLWQPASIDNGYIEDVAFSPDSHSIGYTLRAALGVEDLYVYDREKQTSRRLTFDRLKIHGIDWFADGQSLIISSNRQGAFNLWRVGLADSVLHLLPGSATGADAPRAGGHRRIVYEAWQTRASIQTLSLDSRAINTWSDSTRLDWSAQVSPDGTQVVFISDRTGSAELWLANRDGTAAYALTQHGGAYVHSPRWSIAGDNIIYAAPVDGNFDLYLIDPATQATQRLTTHPAEDFAPTWMPEGQSIVFGSNRSGDWQIHQLQLETGELRQLTQHGGKAAQVSPDGKRLYFVKAAQHGLWQMPLNDLTKAPERLPIDLQPLDWNNWQVVNGSIFYLSRTAPSQPVLFRYSTESGESHQVIQLDKFLYHSGLHLTPDSNEIWFSTINSQEADVMLLEY